jgi:hypothetical protein
MEAEEARPGIRVRVRDSLPRFELRGKEGAFVVRWGHPDYLALDVLLDDGHSQPFWHPELEDIDRPLRTERVQMETHPSEELLPDK